uniref:Seryl-tRNA synthetase 2, mitochondrial n=1 Tax=Hucho hucho TaxID=62062 RepID=A0A4W5QY60_9TELE
MTFVTHFAHIIFRSRHFIGCLIWQGTKVFTPSRSTHEIAKGYSDKPDLDMRLVCEETDKVIANVETRKWDLRGADVREIVSVFVWQQLEVVHEEISQLEEQKKMSQSSVNPYLHQIPEFKEATKEGREIRHRLTLRLPNTTHPDPIGDESQSRVMELLGQKPAFDFKPRGHLEIGEELGLIRQRLDTLVMGHYLRGAWARLQSALQNFEGCGMQPHAHRSQVYSLDPTCFPVLNLAGTGEVGVAGEAMNHAVNWKDLPVRSVCSSTCYRAETDTCRETWGLYRVHHFNKVEMFGVTGEESSQMLEEFLSLQKEIFSSLELHYRSVLLSGSLHTLNISSGSNCTDYQNRPCAIPRAIIAILETHQTKEGTVCVPRALQPYLGMEVNEKPKCTPLKYIGPNQPNHLKYDLSPHMQLQTVVWLF